MDYLTISGRKRVNSKPYGMIKMDASRTRRRSVSTLLVFEPILVNLALKWVGGNTTDITGVTVRV